MSASTNWQSGKALRASATSPETSRCLLSWPQANVVVEGGAVTWATAKIGNIFDIFQRTLASSSTAGRDRSAEKCKYKRGSSQTFFYSRQRVTPIVDKLINSPHGIKPLNRRFLRGPSLKIPVSRHRFCSGAWFYGSHCVFIFIGFVDIKARIHFRSCKTSKRKLPSSCTEPRWFCEKLR